MSPFRAAAFAATALFAASTAQADEYWVFFGTGMGAKDAKPGIYRSKFDTNTGKLTEPQLAAEVINPSFINIDPVAGKYLYSVGETSGKEGGGVYSFNLDKKTGALTKVSDAKSGGPGPCHVITDKSGQLLAVANYTGGSTAVFQVNPADGKLNRIGFFQHKEEGKTPRGHCSVFHPNGKTMFVVDLGLDKLKAYTVDAGKVTANPSGDITIQAGAGPRHMTIAPDGKFGYVCGEKDMTVNVIEFSGNTGKQVQSLSTLPGPNMKGNSTAECILDKNGKFVYVSNRGHNTIAVFKVNDDRKLTAVGHITGDIKTPRNFNIDPSGKWMLIGSQDGGKVGVWAIDEKTGLAKETGHTVKATKAICIKFVPVEK